MTRPIYSSSKSKSSADGWAFDLLPSFNARDV